MTAPPGRVVRRRLLRPSWPLTALFVLFPVWWALGLGAFIWPLVAIPMAAKLASAGRFRAPPGFVLWLMFLVWMLASGSQLEDAGDWLVFGQRVTVYLSATVLFLYVFNATQDELPSERAAAMVVWLWLAAVVAGFAALAFPTGGFTSLAELVLLSGLVGNSFVNELIHPELAQVHDFLGYPVARPKAPFVYTNEWGANMALLTPFVFASWRAVSRPLRTILGAGLVASIVPMAFSLNRGLWLSLGAGLLYAAIHLARQGRVSALRAIIALVAVAAGLTLITPLGDLVRDRIATPHSNVARSALYTETTESVLDSPLLGYGSPRRSERNPNLPPVGTHGQLWLVLFSHGIPATLFFVGWFLYLFWSTRRPGSNLALWMHVVVFTALVQMPYYGLLPVPIHLVMLAAALAWRHSAHTPALLRADHVAVGREWA
jgi:polysaccharide biosynthesis protein PslJ